MRKIAIGLGLGVALSFGTAGGGEYHAGSDAICADCHTMRKDATGAPQPTPTGGTWPQDQAGTAGKLKASNETDLCLGCHDGQLWAPDVKGANTGSNVRSAGFISDVAHDGHTLGFKGKPPGGAARMAGLTCVDCHSPHGKRNAYRNLNLYSLYDARGDPDGYPQYYLSTTPFSADRSVTRGDVRIDVAAYAPLGTGSRAYYESANVVYENGASNALDAFCGKCHGTFHADVAGGSSNQASDGGGGQFKRHPTLQRILRPPPAGAYTTKVYQSGTRGEDYVGCLSCHRAHGTDNPFALFYAAPASGPRARDGSESGREAGGAHGLCSNCHIDGR